MSPVEVALRFIAAWLAVGFGLFVAMSSLGAMRPGHTSGAARVWRGVYVLPFLLALGVLALGVAGVARTVPW